MSAPGTDLINKTTVLTRVINDLRQPRHTIVNTLFPTEERFLTEEILFDKNRPNLRLAPFVGHRVRGRVVQEKDFGTEGFRPANIKMRTPLDQNRAITRDIGEPIGGMMSPRERASRQMLRVLRMHRDYWMNTLEWMACQTLLNDGYDVAGEDYPTRHIRFGRPSNYRITLEGDYRWDQDHANADPSDLLQLCSERMAKNGGGIPKLLIMGIKAWMAFKNNIHVVKRLDRYRSREAGTDLLIRTSKERGLDPKGMYDDYSVYTHMDWYETNPAEGEDEGVQMPYIPRNSVILVDPVMLLGTRGFGIIRDAKAIMGAGSPAMPMYTKSWYKEDPGQIQVLTQSAPLVYPYRPQASMHLTVVD